MLKKVNNIIIDEADINTLKMYDIDIANYQNIRELSLAIERLDDYSIEQEELDELDLILSKLQETDYYKNYRKNYGSFSLHFLE